MSNTRFSGTPWSFDAGQYLQDQEDEQGSKKSSGNFQTMATTIFSSVVITRVYFPSDKTFVGKNVGANSEVEFHDDTQRQEKAKKPLVGRSINVERMWSKIHVLDASQYFQDQEDERARRERDLNMSNVESSDVLLPRDWADQSSSDQKSQINDHGTDFGMMKRPSNAKTVKFGRVEFKENVLYTSQCLVDQRDEKELKDMANAWPSLSCASPSVPCLTKKRIVQLESAAAKKNEAVISLMDRVAILEENLCEREYTSSEKEKTFAHVDAE